MKPKHLLFLCVLLSVALVTAVAAGCGGEGTTPVEDSTSVVDGTTTTVADVARSVLECPQGEQSADTPLYGGTLVVIHKDAPTNIGCFWLPTSFADSVHARWAIENLVGLDSTGAPVPQLATSWELDDTAKTVTFHLREGVKFHDGTDFNAEAAKWNLDMFRNAGVKSDLRNVVSVDVVDPYTVMLTMSIMDAGFVQSLSSSNAGKMVSPTAYETMGEDTMKLHPVGTGPFVFESYETGTSLKYTRNPDYWQEGLPYLDGAEIEIVADPMVALTSYKAGEGHVLYQTSPATALSLEAEGSTINTRTLTIYCITGDSTNASSPFSDQKVREGIAYALDVNTIVNGVWGGADPPTNQLAAEGGAGYDSTIVGHPYNQAMAAQLLAESSFNITPTNRWKTKITYIEGDEITQTFTLVQEALAEVGIDLTLEGVPVATLFSKSGNGFKNELMAMGFSYSIELQYLTSLNTNFGKDRTMWVDMAVPAELQALIDQVVGEPDLASREAVYEQFNKMAIDDYSLVIPLYVYCMSSPISPDAHDVGYAEKTIEFLPERAWLSGAANPSSGQ